MTKKYLNVEQIKERADIVDTIGRFVELKKVGKNFVGLCPSHRETKPSFTVYPLTQSFYCWGCDWGGDVINFLMKVANKGFWEVVHDLAGKVGVELEALSDEERKEVEEGKVIDEIRMATVQFYCQGMTVEAQKYLVEKRKFHPDTVAKFRIGWACGGLHKHLLEVCKFPLDACISAGVLKRGGDNEVKDYFFNRYVFPNFRGGRVVHLTGRSANGNPVKWLHMPGEIDFLFNEDALCEPTVYLAEGIPDAISADQHGIPAVAIYGKGFKPQWAEKFSGCDTVYIGLHLHEAKGPETAVEIADLLGDKARIVTIPGEVDLNDYLR